MNREAYIDTLVQASRSGAVEWRVDFYRKKLLHEQAIIPKGAKVWRFGAVVGDRNEVTCEPSRRDRRVRIVEVIAWMDGPRTLTVARWEGTSGYWHWCPAEDVQPWTPPHRGRSVPHDA